MLEHHYEADQQLTAEQLGAAYNPDGDGQHPIFTRDEWVSAVANRDTSLGYWDWLEDQLNSWSFDDIDEEIRKRN